MKNYSEAVERQKERANIMKNKLNELSTEAVNQLATLDMKYIFTSEESDAMLKAIQNLAEFAEHRFGNIADSAKWILQRFNLTDGCKEEIEEIIRLSTIYIKKKDSETERLANFLLQNYSNEIGKGNLFIGESAADVAIRLLKKSKHFGD